MNLLIRFENERHNTERVITRPGYVELEHTEIRTGPEGDPIAIYERSLANWITLDDHQVWTRITVSPEGDDQ